MTDTIKEVLTLKQSIKDLKSVINSTRPTLQTIPNICTQIQATSNPRVDFSKQEDFAGYWETCWELGRGFGNSEPMPPVPSLPGAADEDGIFSSSRNSFKCPISFQKFVNPVTNPACKHTYSRNAIEGLCRGTSGTINCPVSSCSSTCSLRSLIPNVQMAKTLDRLSKDRFIL